MRASRRLILSLILAVFTLSASVAMACDKGKAAAATQSACCQKAAAKTASAKDGAKCPHAAAKTACIGKTADLSIESRRVSPNELVVEYLGNDASSVAELTQAAQGPVDAFGCPLVRRMDRNENCQVEMKAIERGVRFTVTSDDAKLLDTFAATYEEITAAEATPSGASAPALSAPTPENAQGR